MKNRFISSMLATLILIGNVQVVNATTNKTVSELENEKASLEKEKKQITSELEKLYTLIKEKNEEIGKIQTIIDDLQIEIDSLNKDINSLSEDIVAKEEAIAENSLEYEKKLAEENIQQAKLRERLRRNYINNTYNEFLAIILDSDSLSEVATKMKVINNILNNDKKIINNLKEVQKELEETRLYLEATKKELDDNKITLEAKQKNIQEKQGAYLAQKEVLDKEFATLEEIETEKQNKIKYLEKKQQSIDLDIHALLHPETDTGDYDNSVSNAGGVYSMFIKPVTGRITSQFGVRVDPITGAAGNNHTGLDIANSFGTIIRAAADGVVTFAGWNSGGYGKFVIIDHGNGVVTRYAHNQALLVSVGDKVTQGQAISEMGSTGYSTGSHLHFEIKVNGKFLNPLPVYQ